MKETHFGHCPELKTISDVWIDIIMKFAVRLSSLLTLIFQYSACMTMDAKPIRLSISCSIFISLLYKTL